VDKNGHTFIEKIIFNEERPELRENPFLEMLMKQKPWNEAQLEKANKLTGYYININNRDDLDVLIIILFRTISIIKELISWISLGADFIILCYPLD
jgi:hypothetical protein